MHDGEVGNAMLLGNPPFLRFMESTFCVIALIECAPMMIGIVVIDHVPIPTVGSKEHLATEGILEHKLVELANGDSLDASECKKFGISEFAEAIAFHHVDHLVDDGEDSFDRIGVHDSGGDLLGDGLHFGVPFLFGRCGVL